MTNQQFDAAVARMVGGDKSGLKEIYEAYISYVYRIIYEVLRSRENAEDVTSEFFIKLWDKAESYQPGNGHKAFLAVMARNMAIDFLRKYRKEELTAMMQDIGTEPEEEHLTGRQIYSGQIEQPTEAEVIADLSLQAALDTLKEAERQIISMKVLGDLTFKEIAEIMGIPMGTVTWRYQNAIKKLRRCGYE